MNILVVSWWDFSYDFLSPKYLYQIAYLMNKNSLEEIITIRK